MQSVMFSVARAGFRQLSSKQIRSLNAAFVGRLMHQQTATGVSKRSLSSLLQTSSRNAFTIRRGLATATNIPLASELASLEGVKLVREELSKDPRPQLNYAEYVALCKKNGLSAEQAANLARGLVLGGQIVYHPESDNKILRETILLQPSAVAVAIQDTLAGLAVGAKTRPEYKAWLEAQIQKFQAELDPLVQIKHQLDTKARRHADRVMWAGFGFLVTQFAAFTRLVYWEFSWDVMEPISYMLGLGMNIVALAYFLRTRNEYSYDGIRERLTLTRAKKEYVKAGFQGERYQELLAEINNATAAIKRLEKL